MTADTAPALVTPVDTFGRSRRPVSVRDREPGAGSRGLPSADLAAAGLAVPGFPVPGLDGPGDGGTP